GVDVAPDLLAAAELVEVAVAGRLQLDRHGPIDLREARVLPGGEEVRPREAHAPGGDRVALLVRADPPAAAAQDFRLGALAQPPPQAAPGRQPEPGQAEGLERPPARPEGLLRGRFAFGEIG